MLTYGDGLSDINLNKLYDFHTKNNVLVQLRQFTRQDLVY